MSNNVFIYVSAITPLDEGEIQQLMSQGCTYDNAVKYIFDQRYVFHRNGSIGQYSNDNFLANGVPTGYINQSSHNPILPPSYVNSAGNFNGTMDSALDDNRSHYSQGSEKKKKISKSSTVRAGRHQPVLSTNYSVNSASNSSSFSVPAGHNAAGRRSSNHSTHSKDIHHHHSSHNNAYSGLGNKIKLKTADLKQLERMGFTREQAIQALIQNDNNVQYAANALLSSSSR